MHGCALAALLWLSTPVVGAATLSLSLPPGVPDGDGLGWEHIHGDVATSQEGAVYEFYVNPARSGIYEVVRYRFTRAGRAENEKVVWNRLPRGEGPSCFAHEGDGSWRLLRNGSQEYKDEMMTAIRVYAMHRRVRLAN
jgi:hypothetical protein